MFGAINHRNAGALPDKQQLFCALVRVRPDVTTRINDLKAKRRANVYSGCADLP